MRCASLALILLLPFIAAMTTKSKDIARPTIPDVAFGQGPARGFDIDLGIDKPREQTRVVAAMSGGVDSSVVAALLTEAGYDVVGITLQLYDYGAAGAKQVKTRTCCAGQDIYDARRVADKLGIPHYVLDYESQFREDVIDDFADSYLRGETPIPCIRCNQTVKFRDLLEKAQALGADALATGHYVRRISQDGAAPLLHAATAADRDQSYFLFATTREQLDMLRFPLGDMDKEVVRAHAHRFGLVNADKPDSQDICFVPDGDYASLVTRLRPEAAVPGDIVDLNGNVLARHPGIVHFTIGQRKGLGIGGRRGEEEGPLYVVRLVPGEAKVVVGPKEALEVTLVHVAEINWLANDLDPLLDAGEQIEVEARLRSTQAPGPAFLTKKPNNSAVLEMLQPQLGVAPGQAAVFYRESRVLGGGWITGTGEN
jgi:tRNA-specific 2-thiouridylase